MVQKFARQASALAQAMFFDQIFGVAPGREIERIPGAKLASQAQFKDEGLEAVDGIHTRERNPRSALEPEYVRQFLQ